MQNGWRWCNIISMLKVCHFECAQDDLATFPREIRCSQDNLVLFQGPLQVKHLKHIFCLPHLLFGLMWDTDRSMWEQFWLGSKDRWQEGLQQIHTYTQSLYQRLCPKTPSCHLCLETSQNCAIQVDQLLAKYERNNMVGETPYPEEAWSWVLWCSTSTLWGWSCSPRSGKILGKICRLHNHEQLLEPRGLQVGKYNCNHALEGQKMCCYHGKSMENPQMVIGGPFWREVSREQFWWFSMARGKLARGDGKQAFSCWLLWSGGGWLPSCHLASWLPLGLLAAT